MDIFSLLHNKPTIPETKEERGAQSELLRFDLSLSHQRSKEIFTLQRRGKRNGNVRGNDLWHTTQHTIQHNDNTLRRSSHVTQFSQRRFPNIVTARRSPRYVRYLTWIYIHLARVSDHRKVRRRIGAEKCSLDPITKPDRFKRRIRGCDERSYVSRETDERYKWSRSHKRASLRFHG